MTMVKDGAVVVGRAVLKIKDFDAVNRPTQPIVFLPIIAPKACLLLACSTQAVHE